MSLSNEVFRDRLVDYLYGELEGENLREFEAKLAESEECRNELDTLRQTLDLSREGLAQTTDDAPPARVRAAVLAAAEARETRHQMPTASPGRAQPTSEQGEEKVARFWAWLRAPWLLPTMGVCAAVAVVVLGRRIETPQVEPAHDGPASAQQAVPFNDEPSHEERPGAPLGRASPAAPKAEQSADFESEAPRPEPTGLQAGSEGRLRSRSAGSGKGAAPTRAESAAKPSTRGPEQEEFRPSRGYAAPPPAWESLREPERRPAADGVAEGQAPRVARSEAKETRADKAASASKRRTEASNRDLSGYGSLGRGGSVAAESAAPPASAPAASSPAAPPSRAASAPSDDARDTSSADGTRAPDESVKRAREHSTNKRWGEAAVAYRELLQRYPSDPRVPEWRRRLTEAAQALSNVDAVR